MEPTTTQPSPLDPAAQAAIQAAIDKALAPIAAALKAPATSAAAGLPGASHGLTATEAKDLQLDVPPGQEHAARVGWLAKAQYHERAKAFGRGGEAWAKKMATDLERVDKAIKGGYLVAVTKAGQFLSSFVDGGALWSRETVSGEMIEFLRPMSIILGMPGIRTVSGYGSRIQYSKQNTSVTVEWVGEGNGPTASSLTYGEVILGAHKLMGTVPITNDIMRLGTGDAAAAVGLDLQSAGAEAIDDACLNGTGTGKPNGLFKITDSTHLVGITGTTVQNKVDDTLTLIQKLEDAYIPGFADGVYLLASTTYYSLAGLRATDQYVFPELRNQAAPTLHGRPVRRSTKLKNIGTGGNTHALGYVQPMHCVVGEANPMTVEVGESGDDFAKDKMTVRLVGYADFGMRYKKAAAFRNNVSY
jgi:HK97 family phage major capsid protein